MWGVDCDDDALAIARENVEHVDLLDCVRFIRAEVKMKPKAMHATREEDNNDNRYQNKRGGKKNGGRQGTGRGRGGGRGSQPASLTKSRLVYGKEDGVPLEDNCVE